MMTREMVLELIATLGDDVTCNDEAEYGELDLVMTVEDFEGFDEDWDEIYRDYNEEAVDKVWEILRREAIRVKDSEMYPEVFFEGFSVTLEFASYDI